MKQKMLNTYRLACSYLINMLPEELTEAALQKYFIGDRRNFVSIQDIYEQFIERISGKNVNVVVDATKELLLNVLKYRPFLIKPNNHELAEMFGKTSLDEEQMNYYAGKLQDMGAKNVLVSMAGDGAVLFTENKKVYKIGVAKGQVVNSVGAGDSMVAGFVASYFKDRNYEKALKYATAAGGATAFLEGLATKEKTEELLKQL